jgi:hypothetical protein
MLWRRIIAALVVLALVVSVLAVLKVHYVRDELNGSLLWNAQEAYLFLGVVEYGYTFSYLGLIGEWFKELFPFGASPPNGKHYYLAVLRITPDNIARYDIDNFWMGGPPLAFGGGYRHHRLLGFLPQPFLSLPRMNGVRDLNFLIPVFQLDRMRKFERGSERFIKPNF